MTREGQTGLRFRLRHPSGQVETFLVDAERALVGSAPYCEVRLPADAAAREHVEVVATGGVVHVTARSNEPSPLVGGVAVTTAVWDVRTPLVIGATSIVAELVDLAPTTRRTSPLWLLLLVPVASIAAAIIYGGHAGTAEPRVPAAPPLFDAPVTSCPLMEQEQSGAFAEERVRSASSKRERWPFAPREGVDAVPLFELAARCFTAAGEDAEAREASSAAASLRARLEEEYKIRRVRLEHAYRTIDARGAKRELKVLIPMTGHRRGEYVEWLATLDRNVDLELERRSQTRL